MPPACLRTAGGRGQCGWKAAGPGQGAAAAGAGPGGGEGKRLFLIQWQRHQLRRHRGVPAGAEGGGRAASARPQPPGGARRGRARAAPQGVPAGLRSAAGCQKAEGRINTGAPLFYPESLVLFIGLCRDWQSVYKQGALRWGRGANVEDRCRRKGRVEALTQSQSQSFC